MRKKPTATKDMVNHPAHYNRHPSGVECIEVVRHHDFNIGNAIKYLWRAGLKSEEGMTDIDKHIEDLKKAVWYINDEIDMLRRKSEKDKLLASMYKTALIKNRKNS